MPHPGVAQRYILSRMLAETSILLLRVLLACQLSPRKADYLMLLLHVGQQWALRQAQRATWMHANPSFATLSLCLCLLRTYNASHLDNLPCLLNQQFSNDRFDAEQKAHGVGSTQHRTWPGVYLCTRRRRRCTTVNRVTLNALCSGLERPCLSIECICASIYPCPCTCAFFCPISTKHHPCQRAHTLIQAPRRIPSYIHDSHTCTLPSTSARTPEPNFHKWDSSQAIQLARAPELSSYPDANP